MERVKVCHITTVHAPFDDRIFLKECISLSNAGFDVSLVCKIENHTIKSGVKLVSFKSSNGRLSRILIDVWRAASVARKTRAKIFHIHDPELLQIVWLLKLFGSKVIFDSHENVPGQIMSKTWIGPRWLRMLVSFFYRMFESFMILFCDRVISVTEEITNRFPENKRLLIRNFPRLDLLEHLPAVKNEKTKPVIIYAGGLSRIRGIIECIDAIALLNGDAEFWLLGPWANESYRSKCESRPGWKYCKYFGNILPDEVFAWYKKADIGIALLYPEENYLKSLPIKAFEYMAAGLPIVMSDFPYWKTHFADAATFVDPTDSEAIANALRNLLGNDSLRKELSELAADAAQRKYSWDAEALKLIETYRQLTS